MFDGITAFVFGQFQYLHAIVKGFPLLFLEAAVQAIDLPGITCCGNKYLLLLPVGLVFKLTLNDSWFV